MNTYDEFRRIKTKFNETYNHSIRLVNLISDFVICCNCFRIPDLQNTPKTPPDYSENPNVTDLPNKKLIQMKNL